MLLFTSFWPVFIMLLANAILICWRINVKETIKFIFLKEFFHHLESMFYHVLSIMITCANILNKVLRLLWFYKNVIWLLNDFAISIGVCKFLYFYFYSQINGNNIVLRKIYQNSRLKYCYLKMLSKRRLSILFIFSNISYLTFIFMNH
jgi:hypothetical protein